jgi:hypothetical protein
VTAAVFAAVSAAYAAGHWAGDYWVQTHRQACAKSGPGWAGRRACAVHVATYTLTLAACLAVAGWRLGLPLSPGWTAAGLGVSAVTHYAADRRRQLRWLATGAAHLDQAWHWWWLFAAAPITTGGIHG